MEKKEKRKYYLKPFCKGNNCVFIASACFESPSHGNARRHLSPVETAKAEHCISFFSLLKELKLIAFFSFFSSSIFFKYSYILIDYITLIENEDE